jgi:hypothetical protein
MSEYRFKVERVGDVWRVFSICETYGKQFKNFVGEAKTKAAADEIARKAKEAMK